MSYVIFNGKIHEVVLNSNGYSHLRQVYSSETVEVIVSSWEIDFAYEVPWIFGDKMFIQTYTCGALSFPKEYWDILKNLEKLANWKRNKIFALKLIRLLLGIGLKEAKELYEVLMFSGFWDDINLDEQIVVKFERD